jgi:hypothetical protein
MPLIRNVKKDYVFYNIAIGGMIQHPIFMDECVILMLECIESNQILTKYVYQSVLLRIKIHIYHCRDY